MKFVQILEEPIAPGGLAEWTPFVPGGLGEWSTDSRPTSHNHEQHLRSAFAHRLRTRREGGRESWLGLAIEFDEPLSIPAIRATLLAWIDRHEVLRSHVVLKGIRPHDGAPGLVRLSTGPGTVHLRMGKVGWYSDPAPMIDQIAGSFDRATAPLHWPAYMFSTVAREDSFTLLFAGDHSLLDGYSLIVAQDELVTLYRAARDHTTPVLPDVGSYVDFSAQERRLADETGPDHPAIEAWTTFLRTGHGQMPRFAAAERRLPEVSRADAATSASESGPPQDSLTELLLDDDQTNRFTAVCSEAGGSLFAGVLSALAIVYHDMTGDTEFRCVMPRHTREGPEWLASLGWFVGLAPICLDMSDSPTFGQLIARAGAELKHGRAGSTLPYLRVAELIESAHPDVVAGEPRFALSFIDTRYAPGAAAADAG
ncbi:MAG TPA: condensation domain-containing protein, partial [Gordonia sp. (in: high G+C Gram-positive bacteria)]|nr:condensation domain-containing protein [Gordonia sp. (in: high G+C Gram-positive bacteria)]